MVVVVGEMELVVVEGIPLGVTLEERLVVGVIVTLLPVAPVVCVVV